MWIISHIERVWVIHSWLSTQFLIFVLKYKKWFFRSNIFDFWKVREHVKNNLHYRAWLIPDQFDRFSIFNRKSEKWPIRAKILRQLKGRQTFSEWLGKPNVVEWLPLCPGFIYIFQKWPKIIFRTLNGGKKIFRVKFTTTLRHSMRPQNLDS